MIAHLTHQRSYAVYKQVNLLNVWPLKFFRMKYTQLYHREEKLMSAYHQILQFGEHKAHAKKGA